MRVRDASVRLAVLFPIVLALTPAPGRAQSAVPFVGIGDSIGEAVQSADASEFTQPFSFLNLVAWRMGAPFPLPLIATHPFAQIFSTDLRSRKDPALEGLNLAVSGANVNSVLFDRANAADASQINSETDLVLFPRTGSQMEIAEALRPEAVAVWIGNNNALGAVTAFDRLDASQLTPVAEFRADFTQIAARLSALGSKVVFGTLPDVAQIGFLVDGDDLVRFLGSDLGLPAGSRTTIVTMLAIRAGLLDPGILSNPDYVLDPAEAAAISDRVQAFNEVIRSVAAEYGMGVADIALAFDALAAQPLVIGGVPLTFKYLGGLLSLDGVHPSNFGQLLSAILFIDAFNSHYGMNIPQIDLGTLLWFFLTDPFIDLDGDGRVRGRFGAGMLETLGPFLGISGDTSESAAVAAASPAAFAAEYERLTGRDLRRASRAERIEALRQLFGLQRFDPQAR